MSQETLFRGKCDNSNKGKWVYGYYVPADSSPCVLYGERRPIIITKDENTDLVVWYSVDDKTVGEYSRLTDMNGKKFFEGDIVRFDLFHDENSVVFNPGGYGFEYEACALIGTVKFVDGDFVVECMVNDEQIDNVAYNLNTIALGNSEAEIIGNIYDNPELIQCKGEEK